MNDNSQQASRRRPLAAAFSLIELLVVIGLIALMVGGVGFALRDSAPSLAVQNAQGVVAGALNAARTHALAEQTTVRIAIDANPQSDSFMRRLHILVQAGGGWRAVGNEILLPGGAFLVPAVSQPAASFEPENERSWPNYLVSSLTPSSATLPLVDENGAEAGELSDVVWTTFSFSTRGLPGTNNAKLIVASARRSADGLIFDNPDVVRGVRLSRYGATMLVNDAVEFETEP